MELSKEIRGKCKKVLEWLKDAEEESESGSEDANIEFDDRAREIGSIVAKPAVTLKKLEDMKVIEADGEEINIDEI